MKHETILPESNADIGEVASAEQPSSLLRLIEVLKRAWHVTMALAKVAGVFVLLVLTAYFIEMRFMPLDNLSSLSGLVVPVCMLAVLVLGLFLAGLAAPIVAFVFSGGKQSDAILAPFRAPTTGEGKLKERLSLRQCFYFVLCAQVAPQALFMAWAPFRGGEAWLHWLPAMIVSIILWIVGLHWYVWQPLSACYRTTNLPTSISSGCGKVRFPVRKIAYVLKLPERKEAFERLTAYGWVLFASFLPLICNLLFALEMSWSKDLSESTSWVVYYAIPVLGGVLSLFGLLIALGDKRVIDGLGWMLLVKLLILIFVAWGTGVAHRFLERSLEIVSVRVHDAGIIVNEDAARILASKKFQIDPFVATVPVSSPSQSQAPANPQTPSPLFLVKGVTILSRVGGEWLIGSKAEEDAYDGKQKTALRRVPIVRTQILSWWPSVETKKP